MESKHHDLNARSLQLMQTLPLKQKQNPQEAKPVNSFLRKQTQERYHSPVAGGYHQEHFLSDYKQKMLMSG